jgi:hypothetical protein
MTHEQELLKRAVQEIRGLRTENRVQAARLDMFDKMISLFQAEPPRHGGMMAPDLAWEIDKCIEKAEKPQAHASDERLS